MTLTPLTRTLSRTATLDDFSDAELDRIAALGFDWVWFLGVWQTGLVGRQIDPSCLRPALSGVATPELGVREAMPELYPACALPINAIGFPSATCNNCRTSAACLSKGSDAMRF